MSVEFIFQSDYEIKVFERKEKKEKKIWMKWIEIIKAMANRRGRYT